MTTGPNGRGERIGRYRGGEQGNPLIRFILIAFAVVTLTFVAGLYVTGPTAVYDPECSDPTLPTLQVRRHCPRPIGAWERISRSAGW
jgi:hypothetical protein